MFLYFLSVLITFATMIYLVSFLFGDYEVNATRFFSLLFCSFIPVFNVILMLAFIFMAVIKGVEENDGNAIFHVRRR
jgi:ABC-type Na+ efflux pump permease subunit